MKSNKVNVIRETALEVRAIGRYMCDQAQSNEGTGGLLVRAGEMLMDASRHTCGGGMVGCSGGPDCTSDHK